MEHTAYIIRHPYTPLCVYLFVYTLEHHCCQKIVKYRSLQAHFQSQSWQSSPAPTTATMPITVALFKHNHHTPSGQNAKVYKPLFSLNIFIYFD